MNILTKKTILAASMLALGVGVASPAHAQISTRTTGVTAHTFALPGTTVGGTLRLDRVIHDPNGAVSYTFRSPQPGGKRGQLRYTVVVNLPSPSAALALDNRYANLLFAPSDGGTPVTDEHDGVWVSAETGMTTCRASEGFALGRAVVVVSTISADPNIPMWAITYTHKIAGALLQRVERLYPAGPGIGDQLPL